MSAYNGKEKYLFVSYAHRDAEIVLPIIDGLAARGVRLWYDEGIEVGTEWAEFIEERILCCEAFVLLLSRASIESKNCREEFALARETDKKILICYLEELAPSELKHGLRLQVPSYQCVFLTRQPSIVSLIDKLAGARILEECIGASAPKPTETAASTPDDAESPMARDERLEALQSVKSAPAPAPSAPSPAPSAPSPAPTAVVPPRPAATASAAPKPAEPKIKYSEGLSISPLGLLSGIGSCRDAVVVVPPSVHSIKRGAFKRCKRLREVVLPEGITVIPDEVFLGCRNLERITVSKYLKHIGANAFKGCVKLTKINLPADLQFVKDRAFMNCRKLFLAWTPAYLYELGERAFYNCYLVQGMFSTNIRRIGRLALGNRVSTHANIVLYHGTPEQWGQVQRDGKIMSCRVQYVKCNDGKEYVFE